MKMTIVTKEIVLKKFKELLEHTLSYGDADVWAWSMIEQYEDYKLQFEPEDEEDLIWGLMSYLHGIDMPAENRIDTMIQDVDVIGFLKEKGVYELAMGLSFSDGLDKSEEEGRWNEDLVLAIEEQAASVKTPDSYIHLLFVCWYLLLEKGCIKHNIPDDFLLQKLRHNYNLASTSFSDDAKFMFFSGWMLNITPWYFDVKDDELGNALMQKAYDTEPDNKLYKWACRNQLALSEAEAFNLAKNIPDIEFDNLGYTLKVYFKEMLGQL